uniref:PRA1 family protein G2 n=1 Tax=Erigeron canadensis TaxID=72917 RepID=UPI001CB905E4|nr:PRA1 family protein G2 [Erigeron canadensis]
MTTMPSPPPSTTTYITIPISGTDVIFRSFQNLSTFLSHHRPWPEFLSTFSSFTCPNSFTRIQSNLKHFSINYGIITTSCAAVSLLGNPLRLLAFGLVFTLWLVFYFLREDPVVVYGHNVHDHVVTCGLVLVSFFCVLCLGFGWNLVVGIAVGALISVVHAVFRNDEGIYLDENDAVSEGLISPRVQSV